jgi:L-2,4-diaminobutyric acid acetyltransferase
MSVKPLLSMPVSQDGDAVNQLIGRCAPLDENSVYCNLLQCDHFAGSSVIAKKEADVVGFVSGYRVPSRQETLFIWQVAVDSDERGTGLASKMLESLLSRPSLKGITSIETTITEDNSASWALFTRLARHLGAPLEKFQYYSTDTHFNKKHDTEWLAHIGPFKI